MDATSSAFEVGYWAGPLVLILLALGLVGWGLRAMRRTGHRGVVRIITGSLVAGFLALGYTFEVTDNVFESAAVPPISAPSSSPAPAPRPTPAPSPPPKAPVKKFKPKPIPDPGEAQRYGGCNQAIDAYTATRFELIQRARIAWVDGAMSALLAGSRIVVANARCFQDDVVTGAREVTLALLNQAPPRIAGVEPECRQPATDAYRLLGIASGMANASDGDVNLGIGIDALQRRHPDCLSDSDVDAMKRILADDLPAES